ncbi:3207_t:CDS:2, partial [Diversispora eburnea]
MASELMWPYVISEKNPFVEDYLVWVQNQMDLTFRLKYEQIFLYLQVIINFRIGVRHDAILEEINKALKSLIPPIPSQWHWEIAACNYTKFLKFCTNLFNTIGYSNKEIH